MGLQWAGAGIRVEDGRDSLLTRPTCDHSPGEHPTHYCATSERARWQYGLCWEPGPRVGAPPFSWTHTLQAEVATVPPGNTADTSAWSVILFRLSYQLVPMSVARIPLTFRGSTEKKKEEGDKMLTAKYCTHVPIPPTMSKVLASARCQYNVTGWVSVWAYDMLSQ